MSSTRKTKKIRTGKVDIPSEAFERKNAKVRVTTMLDGDVLHALKAQAAKDGIPYQTWLNSRLRDMLLGEQNLESRVKQLEEMVAELKRNRAA